MIKYIPEVCPNTNICHTISCSQVGSDVKYICDKWGIAVQGNEKVRMINEEIEDVLRWNKCRESMSLDNFNYVSEVKRLLSLKRPYYFEDEGKEWKREEFKKEVEILLNNGDKVFAIEDFGVFEIVKTEKGYSIEGSVHYSKNNVLQDVTLEEIANYLLDMWE